MSNVSLPLSELRQGFGIAKADTGSSLAKISKTTATSTSLSDFLFDDLFLTYFQGNNTFAYEQTGRELIKIGRRTFVWKPTFTAVKSGNTFTVRATFTKCRKHFYRLFEARPKDLLSWTDDNKFVEFVSQSHTISPNKDVVTVDATFKCNFKGTSTLCNASGTITTTNIKVKLNDATFNDDLMGEAGISAEIKVEAGPGPEIPSIRFLQWHTLRRTWGNFTPVVTKPNPITISGFSSGLGFGSKTVVTDFGPQRPITWGVFGAFVAYAPLIEWTSPYDFGRLTFYVDGKVVTTVNGEGPRGEKGVIGLGTNTLVFSSLKSWRGIDFRLPSYLWSDRHLFWDSKKTVKIWAVDGNNCKSNELVLTAP